MEEEEKKHEEKPWEKQLARFCNITALGVVGRARAAPSYGSVAPWETGGALVVRSGAGSYRVN